MKEIRCPHCGTIFKIDESDFESIVKQIRNEEFNNELLIREQQFAKEKETALNLQKIDFEKNLTAKDYEIQELKSQLEKTYNKELTKKELEITELKNQLKLKETKTELAIKNAITEKDRTIDDLNNKIEINQAKYLLQEKNLKEGYEEKIKNKDEQIAYYKDFKAKQSTKMIGESLEQHCSIEFNRLRPLFKNAYFAKDNDSKTGSKGDFIFRDFDDNNNEIVSIMFEMKNEADETATKHKNEDFLKELDKDRREKNCEYAVLVSMLEIDNDYYNDGIVDVSHLYDKMYVIRPQFFIPMITLIRNLALKSLEYKEELALIRAENIDITHFEENITNFKEGFVRNYRLASDRFKKAIEEIDKTIDHLQKTKENLQKTDDNLRLANNKIDDLSIKKLTHNNPTMKKMFAEAKAENDNNVANL